MDTLNDFPRPMGGNSEHSLARITEAMKICKVSESYKGRINKNRNPNEDEQEFRRRDMAADTMGKLGKFAGHYLRMAMGMLIVYARGKKSQSAAPKSEPGVFEPDVFRLGPEELKRVPGLTISREGVGQIAFHGETDCSGVDFGRAVRLEVGEVCVYPDGSSKPPPGTGLNKAATIVMMQCWPPNGGGRSLEDAGTREKYKQQIKKMTEEKNATFIDYDCSSGVWQFAVEHF
ncbi:unnamed protein product [Prorocentrum cordatum]|uniref:Peptidase S59 domain-containing protein n=1 Tax=Prorocentrum cordatum TaxID=2364126 RepID=A0ABN9WG16_9DINO|nr:unnamed protein product [Polarella glacialis]